MAHLASNALRAVTFRISSTPTKLLPHVIPWIVNTLQNSKTLLASAGTGKARDSTDGVLVHKFKTQISTLLNDKTSAGRWAAVVLIKTTVDLGGWEILQGSGAWVRGLLTILGKQDSSVVKKLCIITLTRIFLCTHEYPTLIREITTPSLPAFLTACLNLVEPRSTSGKTQQMKPKVGLLPVVLESFCQLLPHHPTIFRSFETRLTDILMPLMAPAESFDKGFTSSASAQFSKTTTVDAAQKLYILLHYCAPKATSSDDWLKRMSLSLGQCHRTADIVFRAIIEDYAPIARSMPQDPSTVNFATLAKEEDPVIPALPAWHGLRAGSARLVGLLGLVKSFITTQTAAPVSFPVAEIVDIALRILSVTGPTAQGAHDQSTFNKEISRDERDELWIELPSTHTAAIEVLGALFERFENASVAVIPLVLNQIAWTFKRDRNYVPVRLATYETVAKALTVSASGFTRAQVIDLSRMARSACEDILPEEQNNIEQNQPVTTLGKGHKQKQTGSLNADSFLNPQTSTRMNQGHSQGKLCVAATGFMTSFLARVPTQHLGQSLRATIDRTAVLSEDPELMLAAVLNPPYNTSHGKSRSSILPLLARAAPDHLAVEGLLRPRLPAIKMNLANVHADEEDNEEDNEHEQVSEIDSQADNAEEDDNVQEAPDGLDIPANPHSSAPVAQTNSTGHLSSSTINGMKAITDSLKRNASAVDVVSSDARRSRTRAQDNPNSVLDIDSASEQLLKETAMPVSVIVETSSKKAAEDTITSGPAVEVVLSVAERDSDGSDIEIPEIDIESDTEEEDDEEEVEEADELA